jgi:hypothetical protein
LRLVGPRKRCDPDTSASAIRLPIDTCGERVGKAVFWGVASTSRSRDVAERFGNVPYVIHTRARPYIGDVEVDVPVFRSEQEVLLARGTCRFVIEGVTTDRGT